MNSQLRHHIVTYTQLDNLPVFLSKEEIEQPQKVLAEFFDCYHLQNIRSFLKLWLHEALRPNEILQMDYLTLHDHLLKLTEAAWLLHQSKSIKPKRKNKK